jgi:exodeoxyribonuclease VII large subunit
MPVPVIMGVGHVVERSVADEVAHTSCKTPTACAQVLVARVETFARGLDAASHRVVTLARARTVLAAREIDEAARRAQRGVPAVLARERALVARHHGRIEELVRLRLRDTSRHLDDCSRRVGERGRARLREASATLDGTSRRVQELSRARLREAGLTLDTSAATVRALDPRRVLERGYSITRDEHGRSVRRVTDTTAGAVLHTELADGVVVSTVDRIDEDGEDR